MKLLNFKLSTDFFLFLLEKSIANQQLDADGWDDNLQTYKVKYY